MPRSTLLAYARLIRIPNVFTAMADIGLGAAVHLAVSRDTMRLERFILILVSSSCLYMSGMVWNDLFDLEVDRRERPFRPLPSGKIAWLMACLLGTVLMAIGCVTAWAAGSRSGWVALLLAMFILLYDAILKSTWCGPIAMASCRFLNVQLGLSLIPIEEMGWQLRAYLGIIVAVYIAGLTWFAKGEATISKRAVLHFGAAVMLAAIALCLPWPVLLPSAQPSLVFVPLIAVMGFALVKECAKTARSPSPIRVQSTVKKGIFGLVLLDAALASATCGTAGLLLVLLLLPAIWLGKWVYST